ncbi:MAG: TolC family protein [Chloroflexaceae bacterium]|nr:TolC family protein [Chloroflexaceae bacterium]
MLNFPLVLAASASAIALSSANLAIAQTATNPLLSPGAAGDSRLSLPTARKVSVTSMPKPQLLTQQTTPPQPSQTPVAPVVAPQVPPPNLEALPPNRPVQPGRAPTYLNPGPNPLLFPTTPAEVEAAIVQPITLEQAIELGLQNNQELAIQRLAVQRAQEELRIQLAEKYPTLDFSADIQRTDSANAQLTESEGTLTGLGAAGITVNPDTVIDTFSSALDLNLDLYTGGRRQAEIETAKRQIRLSQLQLEQETGQTRFDVARLYYALQSADAQVNIERGAVADATQTLRDAQLLEQAGLGTRFDVLRAEVELANANQNLVLALADQRTSRRELAEEVNVGQQIVLAAADVIDEAGTWELTLEESIVLALQNRAELQQFLLEREINQLQGQIFLANVRPQISIFANYNILEEIDDTDTGLADGYQIGARFRWRLFDGGDARARAAQAKTDRQIDELEFSNQRDQVRLEVEGAFFDLQANQENIRTTERAVELAEESLRLARLRFQAGVGTQTDVIDAQTELTTARGNFLNAIISYNQSFNALQRAVSNVPDNLLFDQPDRP